MLIVQTPLRISLFGGGTDFPDYYEENGGCVLSTAINKYVYVVINKRFDRRVRVSCTHLQTVSSIDKIKHDLIREAMIKTGMAKGVDIYTIGDLSAGMGLGSSSSITVGLLKAMYEYMGNPVTTEQIAREACEIERDILGKPIGVQDQYIAAYGGFRFINFEKNKIGVSSKLDGRKLNEKLLMFFTGYSHKSEDILTEQKTSIGINVLNLGKLKFMTDQALICLGNEEYESLGYLLDESWKIKKKLSSNVSNPEIDKMYDLAIRGGAIGGKITGAGGGGFLLVYVPLEKRESVRRAMRKYRELPFNFEPDGTKVVYNK